MHTRCPELQEECVLFIVVVYSSKISLSSDPQAAPSPPPSLLGEIVPTTVFRTVVPGSEEEHLLSESVANELSVSFLTKTRYYPQFYLKQ